MRAGHPALYRPRKRIRSGITGSLAAANHLTTIVHRTGHAVRGSESPEIDHPVFRVPQERVLCSSVERAGAYDLARGVHGNRSAGMPAKINDSPLGRPQEWVPLA